MPQSDGDRQRIRAIEQARLLSLSETCSPDELVKEALLTRGFLATLDHRGLILAEGSHENDARVLEDIEQLAIMPIGATSFSVSVSVRDPERARTAAPNPQLKFFEHTIPKPNHSSTTGDAYAIAKRIVGIADNRGMTTVGVGTFTRDTWGSYRRMRYGARIAVRGKSSGSLDLGIALLVKALPLARVGTHMSCDGHGRVPARIWFWTRWDAFWFEAILGRFPPEPGARWSIIDEGSHPVLSIAPDGDIANDQALAAMLGSIRSFARAFLDTERTKLLGARRQSVLNKFGEREPSEDEWRTACKNAL
jgi:hypothetical protein